MKGFFFREQCIDTCLYNHVIFYTCVALIYLTIHVALKYFFFKLHANQFALMSETVC